MTSASRTPCGVWAHLLLALSLHTCAEGAVNEQRVEQVCSLGEQVAVLPQPRPLQGPALSIPPGRVLSGVGAAFTSSSVQPKL